MISFSDIEEFPFSGRIYRIIESSMGDDEEDTVYEGVMDVNLVMLWESKLRCKLITAYLRC